MNSAPPKWSRWNSVTFLLVSAGGLPEWPGRWVCRALAMVFGVGMLSLWIAYGVRRRLPHWSTASWLRYLVAFLIPVALLVLPLAMAQAVDARSPIAGASQSPLRFAWVIGILLSLVIGGIRLLVVLDRMVNGDPALPYPPPRPARTQAP